MTDDRGATGPSGDLIELRDLRVVAFCGVLPEEQARRQPFAIDLDLVTDLSVAGRTDDLDDTIDYGAVTDAVIAAVDSSRFALLERLAQAIATVVLADERVRSVTVSVRKLRPPVPHDLASSGVRISRTRP